MFDRVRDHSVVFDIDGTVSAARQRSIHADQQNDPLGKRRSGSAYCATITLGNAARATCAVCSGTGGTD